MIFTAIITRNSAKTTMEIDVIADTIDEAIESIDDNFGAEVLMIAPKGELLISL